jgi:hypothetical protein
MDSNSTIASNSYLLSPPYSFRTETTMSSDTSSVFSMYSQKTYTNFNKLQVKTRKMSMTSKWFTTKLRSSTTTKPVKQARKEKKLETKTPAKKRFSIRLAPNVTTPVTDNTYGLDTLFNMDKHLKNKYRSTILKIMDKPLEWFRIKSKKSNLRRKSTTNFKSLVVNKNAMISSHTNNKSQIVNLNFLMSAPSMSSSLNYEFTNNDISNNYLNYNSYLTEQKFHSTPQSQYRNRFSPIALSKSSEINCSSSQISSRSRPISFLLKSTPINSSLTQNKSMFSSTPSISRRLSFGITSSPKPLNSYGFKEDNSHQNQANLSESFNSFNSNNDLNEHQQRLIDHINSIKQSVKLGVEMRNKKTYQFDNNDSFKQWEHGTRKTKKEEERVMSKRKKLQKIFQIKLKKQLKEMKNWQMSVKSDFETQSYSENIQNPHSNECFAGFKKFRNSTNNSIDSVLSNEDSFKNRHTCDCKFFKTEHKQNVIIYQNNFNYIDCVNNYF